MKKSFVIAALSSTLTVHAFAAVSPNSASDVSTVEAGRVTESAYSEKPTRLTVELVGVSAKLSSKSTGSIGGTDVSDSSSTSGTDFGGIAGGFVYKPTQSIGLEANLALITKKFDHDTDSKGQTTQPDGQASARFSTVRATMMGRYYPIQWVSVGAGPYVSSFVGDIHATDSNGKETTGKYSDIFMNRMDYGMAVGGRGEIPVTASLALTLDARYFYGLRNLIDEDAIRSKLSTAGMTAEDMQFTDELHTRDFQFGAGLAVAF